MSGILLILIVAAIGITFYYFKVLKPKQAIKVDTDLSELDDLDFDDEYLNIGEADSGADGQDDE